MDSSATTYGTDPSVPDWANLELPNTWADQLDFRRPSHVWRFLRCVLGRERQPVQLPESLSVPAPVPKYILQEFHGLPNGNYSKRITRGYITGFDRSMLGAMAPARHRIAESLRACESVLDVGCAGGRTAHALQSIGTKEVWGLDPSPYLLQHAAKDYPGIHFTQGVAEATGFSDGRFDGIAACFLFHEIPPRYVARVLDEFHRILKPGGLVAICEPSPIQREQGLFSMFKRFGWKGVYFSLLAGFVHEPFLDAWHKIAKSSLFNDHGFEIVEDKVGMPLRHIVLRRRSTTA